MSAGGSEDVVKMRLTDTTVNIGCTVNCTTD